MATPFHPQGEAKGAKPTLQEKKGVDEAPPSDVSALGILWVFGSSSRAKRILNEASQERKEKGPHGRHEGEKGVNGLAVLGHRVRDFVMHAPTSKLHGFRHGHRHGTATPSNIIFQISAHGF